LEIKLLQTGYPTFRKVLRQLNVHGNVLSFVDEDILLEQCRNQDRRAQKIVYEMHFKKLMPVCLRYLRREDDALEVLNDAFLKIFSKINQFKSEGSLEAWMKRIVINSSIDFIRKNKSYRSNFIHTNEFHIYGEPGQEQESERHEPAHDISIEAIFEMVAELPPASRVVFNLFVIDGFGHKQIAEGLKISEGTSKWHLSNARKILREKILKSAAGKTKTLNHGEAGSHR
jgi:RNA polymerase sigma factor (sigma-70 family)